MKKALHYALIPPGIKFVLHSITLISPCFCPDKILQIEKFGKRIQNEKFGPLALDLAFRALLNSVTHMSEKKYGDMSVMEWSTNFRPWGDQCIM